MGRWTYLTIVLKGVKVTLVSAYRVCKQATDLEKNTACMQQWRDLAEKQNKPEPIKQMLLDLKKFLKEEEKMIDANEGSITGRTR